MKYPILIAGVLLAFVLFQHGVVFQLGGNYFRNQQEQLANSKAQEMAGEMAGRVDLVRTGARAFFQRNGEIFRDLLRQPDDRAEGAAMARQIISSFPLIEALGVIDSNGRSVMTGDKTVLDDSVMRAASARLIADAGSLPVIVQADTPQPYYYAVATVAGADGQQAAAVLRFSDQSLTQIIEPRTIAGHEALLVNNPPTGPTWIVGATAGASAGLLLPDSDAFPRISARAPVAGTIWEVVVVAQENLYRDFFWMRIRAS